MMPIVRRRRVIAMKAEKLVIPFAELSTFFGFWFPKTQPKKVKGKGGAPPPLHEKFPCRGFLNPSLMVLLIGTTGQVYE